MKKYISIWILIALLFTGCASSREEIPIEPSAPAEKTDNRINMTVFEKIFLPLASREGRPSMEDLTEILKNEGIAWSEKEGIVDILDYEHEGSYLYGILTNEQGFVELAEIGYHFQAAGGEYEVKADMTGKETKYFVDVTLPDSGTEVPSIDEVKTYIYNVVKGQGSEETAGIPFRILHRGFTPLPLEDRDAIAKFTDTATQIIQNEEAWGDFMGEYCPGIPYFTSVDFASECLVASVHGFARPMFTQASKPISLRMVDGYLRMEFSEEPEDYMLALNNDKTCHFYVVVLVVNRADLPEGLL